ncbi:MAG: hypothetical protein QF724_00570 [Planctomycetota bacterium]|jgi:hypothetical protein|nr:hypothetical protein [Planctomycetota bacterium]MDP6368479.1 hypothetical protein [Planctomycetota bacterium]MDP6520189.1 hypothetical protein [Planctomycetota bacterium]MDP6837411.1 hypothetical protein [Planctomycetota bacterium]MDP6956324.1 hypothetical protein [Planctomycetota bacterium]
MKNLPAIKPALLTTSLALGALALTSAPASAQMRFSIDIYGHSTGAADTFSGTPIKGGDLLVPATFDRRPAMGPLPTPGTYCPEAVGGLNLTANVNEVDALSYGKDMRLDDGTEMSLGRVWFSVDEWTFGITGLGAPPSVQSEYPFGDASADVFVNRYLPTIFPVPPIISPNRAFVDGDGLASGSGFAYVGSGLIEPATAAARDNVDAVDFQSPLGSPPDEPVYFSLDAYMIHPVTGNWSLGSAIANYFVGGDILVTPSPTMAPGVYAAAVQLGLDMVGGPDSDDVDALILAENGDGIYTPSRVPFDWQNGASDMLFFSVRRGSAVIGQPDSIFGLPIEPGDILTTPLHPQFGGLSPFPGIVVSAESLGLATLRTPSGANIPDDLNAADILEDRPSLYETTFCVCDTSAPCGNTDPTWGCANSTGSGASLTASGDSSVTGNLDLTAANMPAGQFGVGIIAPSTMNMPFRDGKLCLTSGIVRLGIRGTGGTGSFSFTGVVGVAASRGVAIVPGDTWYFQAWYRDPAGPCANGSNLTNGVEVLFY